MKRRIKELLFMARDFWSVSTGRDYFHQPQPLGPYFRDSRCYYNDLTGKAFWPGTYLDGVPALYIPAWGGYTTLPVMVLQYGLGCVDRFFLEGDRSYLNSVSRVVGWLLQSLLPNGSLDSRMNERLSCYQFHSSNSCMVQGEALSFSLRVIRNKLVDEPAISELAARVHDIFSSMATPLEKGGTALWEEDKVYLCEYCRLDNYVVLNGWIFAIFGLIDYFDYCKDPQVKGLLDVTLGTLRGALTAYQLRDGWSYYDNKRRISSPFYHELHVSLLDALYRLTNDEEFQTTLKSFRAASTFPNKAWYTVVKIRDRISDKNVYVTQR
jgi:hypothetical protein